MHKTHSTKVKQRVSEDFTETLNTIIRTLSTEEINIKDEFEKPDNSNDFYKSSETNITTDLGPKPLQKRQSIYKSRSFKNYEVVVTDNIPSSENENSKSSVSTRPILKTQPSMNASKPKMSKFQQIFFPTMEVPKSPFPRTTVKSFPFHLNIEIIDKNKTIKIQVTEYYTVRKVKSKIFKKENIAEENQALFFKGTRLEGAKMLYNYGIKSNSQLQVKNCEYITISGQHDITEVTVSTMTSATISDIKELFAEKMSVKSCSIELRHKEEKLEEFNELFVYSVIDGFKIEIVKLESVSNQNQGYDVVDKFFTLTQNLKKCKCNKQRIDAMSFLFISLNDKKISEDEINKCSQFLKNFDASRGYHHINCFKLISSPKSELNSVSEYNSAEFSGSESGLKSAVLEENEKVNKQTLDPIDENFIKYLSECSEFEEFKYLLKNKIGTKCSIRSVALLYRYTRYTVRYIGLDEHEISPDVERILDFTISYFNKYFKRNIIEKGGLDALVLSVTDVD